MLTLSKLLGELPLINGIVVVLKQSSASPITQQWLDLLDWRDLLLLLLG